MKNIKLNMNRGKLTGSEIEQGKFFQKILEGAKSTASSVSESIFRSTLFLLERTLRSTRSVLDRPVGSPTIP